MQIPDSEKGAYFKYCERWEVTGTFQARVELSRSRAESVLGQAGLEPRALKVVPLIWSQFLSQFFGSGSRFSI